MLKIIIQYAQELKSEVIFMSIQAKNIRNVVFAGHASKGKTTLCEALLNVAGTTE